MKRIIVSIFMALLLAGTSTLAFADAKADYDKECAKCHGVDGKGDTKMGKKLQIKDLTDAKVQATFTDAEAEKYISEGIKDKKTGRFTMKGAAKKLPPEQIRAVVKYVRSLAGK